MTDGERQEKLLEEIKSHIDRILAEDKDLRETLELAFSQGYFGSAQSVGIELFLRFSSFLSESIESSLLPQMIDGKILTSNELEFEEAVSDRFDPVEWGKHNGIEVDWSLHE